MKKSEGFLIGGLIVAIALHILFMGDWWAELFDSIIATLKDFWDWLIFRILAGAIGLYIGIWLIHRFEKLRPASGLLMKWYSGLVSFVSPALADIMYAPFESEEEKKEKEAKAKKEEEEAKKKAKEDEKKAEEDKRRNYLEEVRIATEQMKEATKAFNDAKKN